MAGAGELTDKQKRFCKEYLVDFNATQAAIRAGYAKGTANREGSRLLSKADIQTLIAKLSKRVEEKLELTAERVLYEIKCLAYADPMSYYEQKGGRMVLRDPFTFTDAQRRAIRSLDVKNGKLQSITLYNKDPSLDKLGKNLKLFTELNETVHSFTMMGGVTAKEKAKRKGQKQTATVTVRELTFEVGDAPRGQ